MRITFFKVSLETLDANHAFNNFTSGFMVAEKFPQLGENHKEPFQSPVTLLGSQSLWQSKSRAVFSAFWRYDIIKSLIKLQATTLVSFKLCLSMVQFVRTTN